MARDIRLTVAAATVGPQIKVQVLAPVSAVEAVVPKLELTAGVATSVRAEVSGEAV